VAVGRLQTARDRLRDHPVTRTPDPESEPVLHEAADRALGDFATAMDADLNTSVALSVLHAFARKVNARLDARGSGPISDAEQDAGLRVFARIDRVLGILSVADAEEEEVDDDLQRWVEERIEARARARRERDFERADAIRDELAGRGVTVEDTAEGTRWSL